ncbi:MULTISPECIES: TrbC/VirB2 family protein [Luteimonas]|uniref:Type VI secretion protein n=1 Tax=Luteimonas chenhongjianii TaxID=2006110 RepID=A0A290XHI6_9GAMM|nr:MULTISPECIES: TrbC/VirB2 family protein [Luteimonas]ATD68406.1 type VI secretion protein [Luteimonas chenhongjianii]RPD87909.1 type VI secretion protein [Luteimonas sp. 100069]
MQSIKSIQSTDLQRRRVRAFAAAIAVAFLPSLGWAQDVAGATSRVQTFFGNINALLNVASIAVVTIAIIFAGYQIAFNHKRIGDVAPVLIGGFLIGAAAQIAKMLLPSDVTSAAMLMLDLLPVHA